MKLIEVSVSTVLGGHCCQLFEVEDDTPEHEITRQASKLKNDMYCWYWKEIKEVDN
jgi:hypothetical protein